MVKKPPVMRTPCSRCPWRRDTPTGYWDPQHFIDLKKNCTGNPRTIDGELKGLNSMLCHKSPGGGPIPPELRSPLSGTLEEPTICAGWVLVEGDAAMGVRLHYMWHREDLIELVDAASLDLYDSVDEMLLANGIPVKK